MLTFDPIGHVYKWNSNVVPSVTQVLKSAGIIDHKFTAPGAMEKGTDAHQAIEFWNQGDLDEDSLADDLRGYVDAWKSFVYTCNLQMEITELKVYDKVWKFAGTIDYIGVAPNYRCMVDIKTGAQQPWHALQLAAYRQASGLNVHCLNIYLKSDGTYQAPKVDMTNAWAVFQSALNLYNWKGR